MRYEHISKQDLLETIWRVQVPDSLVLSRARVGEGVGEDG
jgi:hypothetical protein